jgi:hypothetical protein
MGRELRIFICAMLTSIAPLFGQGPTLTGAGYTGRVPIRIAPGQITTLFVAGLKTVLPQPVRAPSLPLPNSLAGISVTINQSGASYPAPLVSVQQVGVCSSGGAPPPPPPSLPTPDCVVTAIIVQVPYEIVAARPGDSLPLNTEIEVSENGATSKAFQATAVIDNLHVLSTCDSFPSPGLPSSACVPVVAHGDGTLVTVDTPATAGEEIVIYAFGLGSTSPAVKTGNATPAPAPVLTGNRLVYVQFDFRPNASPSPPYFNPLILAPFVPVAIFTGLTPGEVGLYQINVRIPSSLPPLGRCTPGAQPGLPYNSVLSNVTIDIGANTSFDGAAICVAPAP